MPSSLAIAKKKFETDLQKLLYDAYYAAECTFLLGGDADPVIDQRINKDSDEAFKKKSDTFAKNAAPPLADAIYNYILEMKIDLTPEGTLIAPQAPSGALPVQGISSTMTGGIKVS